ncbi:sigma-54-dependent Fis family transcriptional regulator [Candidatus Sumerlaeota bacterium]|nr:sigma-54-dependent Fis family transcriptional regulator [Candidatus Sumerlaeota bacterium]
MVQSYHILVVDDEQIIRFVLHEALEKEGYIVDEASNGEEAVLKVRNVNFDLIILDIKMPVMDGIEALKEIRKIDPGIPVVMITAFGNSNVAMQALKEGAYDYFNKPFDVNEIRIVIKRALEKQKLQKQIEILETQLIQEHRFDRIIGTSQKMQEVFALIRKVITNDVTVLICGESGTGKELVAQAIHYHSERAKKPFIKVSCVAIPDTLLESEMFGYERGAFTGAHQTKIGKFELAQGGTFFLDEIGDMPLGLQVKLLRVIQERELERIGGNKTIKVDIRLVACTNRDLVESVKNQTFREDLYFRINVLPIYLPPLRERKDDIPLLVEHFIKYYNQKLGKHVVNVSDDVMRIIQQYPWPGNVRELENVIQRAIILSPGETITADLLPPNVHAEPVLEDISRITDDFDMPMPDRIQILTEKIEKKMIQAALAKSNNRRQETADLLGISRKSLHNKMQKYELFDN